jgi:hypothetical protein
MRNRDARVAGLLYLIAIVVGVFDLMYLPDKIVILGDAAATAHNILANPFVLRLAIVADLVAGVIWLFVMLALYKLLRDVDEIQAGLMLILGAFMQVPLYFVSAVFYVGSLLLVSDATVSSVFAGAQRDAMAFLFLRLHHYEIQASLVFAGLWLFPFGILVFESGFLPRTIGVWLMLSGFAWLAICFTGFLAPQYSATVSNVTFPLTLGEFAITFWLLIMGDRTIRFRRDVQPPELATMR